MPLLTHQVMIFSLIIGTSITLATNNQLLMWIGLEINTMAIVPFMLVKLEQQAIKAMMKYYLTQAAASILLLSTVLFNAWKTGEWHILTTTQSSIMVSITLMMKLGLAPMHFWVPPIFKNIPLSTGLMLSAWQKLAPMALLFKLSCMDPLMLTPVSLLSVLVWNWNNIDPIQTRMIMAFSSVGHLSWMILILYACSEQKQLGLEYYILVAAAMLMSLVYSSLTMVRVPKPWMKSPTLAVVMTLILLSLAGLFSLLEFMPKITITIKLIKSALKIAAALAMLEFTLTTLYHWRLSLYSTMLSFPYWKTARLKWAMSMWTHFTTTLFIAALTLIVPLATLLSWVF